MHGSMIMSKLIVRILGRLLVLMLTYGTIRDVHGDTICHAILRMSTGNDDVPTDLIGSQHSNISDTGFRRCRETCAGLKDCTAVSFDRRSMVCYIHVGNGQAYQGIGSRVPSVVFAYAYMANRDTPSGKIEMKIPGMTDHRQLPGEHGIALVQLISKSISEADPRPNTVDSSNNTAATLSHPVRTPEASSLASTRELLTHSRKGVAEVHGEPCSSDADCTSHLNGSSCSSHRCQCQFPLGFSEKDQACVLCTTFKQLRGHKVKNHNDYMAGADTFEECELLCRNLRKFTCNSFDYCINKNSVYRWMTDGKPACLQAELSFAEAREEEAIVAKDDCVLGYRVCQ